MENKRKFPLWIQPQIMEQVKKLYETDNCNSQSEFIEKAVRYYIGSLSAQSALEYLPVAISTAMSGAVGVSENRISRLLFKLAVEMSIMMNVLAADSGIDPDSLRSIRGKCVEDVKKSVGAVNFDAVLHYQQGD